MNVFSTVFSSLTTILITVFIFGFLIFVHELGHYLVGRWSGMGIREFSIGMGPKIVRWKGKKNYFAIRWLPIGGYVSFVGETPGEEPDPEDVGKVPMNSKPIWQRILVTIAGPLMNLLIALLIMLVVVATSTGIASTVVAAFNDGATTSGYGLQAGDEICKVNGKNVYVYSDMSYIVALDGKKPLDVEVLRNGEKVTLTIQFPEAISDGIALGTVDFKVYRLEKTVGEVLYQSFFQSVSAVRMTIASLGATFSGQFGWEAVSGPIGIGGEVSEIIKTEGASIGMIASNLATFAVLISISLGICNLLPIPVLDGGRILFYLIEAIRRKPMNPKVEQTISTVFMIVLMAFMLFVAVKDIFKLL